MGSEQSLIKGLEIEEKATEVSDYWSVYSAKVKTDAQTSLITIFQGDSNLNSNQSLWQNKNPLEKAAKVCFSLFIVLILFN